MVRATYALALAATVIAIASTGQNRSNAQETGKEVEIRQGFDLTGLIPSALLKATPVKAKCTACHSSIPTAAAAGAKDCLRSLLITDGGDVEIALLLNDQKLTDGGVYGVDWAPVDDAVRAQTAIPAKQGLIVREVRPTSPLANQLHKFDVLLKIDNNPVATVEDCAKRLSAAKAPLLLEVVRQGKPLAIRFNDKLQASRQLVDLVDGLSLTGAVAATSKDDFWIGTSVSQVDETLRSHLPELRKDSFKEAGLVVLEVHKGSPAEKAALRKNDVLCSLDYKPLKSSEDLVARVQDCGGKKVKLQIVRNGELKSLDIEPTKRPKSTANPAGATTQTVEGFNLVLAGQQARVLGTLDLQHSLRTNPQSLQWLANASGTQTGVDEQLKQLSAQLLSIQKQMDKLREMVDKQSTKSLSKQEERIAKTLEDLRILLEARK